MGNAKYAVGDKVKIRSDLKENAQYASNNCVKDMVALRGQEAVITDVYGIGGGIFEYCINIDKGHWFWTEQMFEKGE